jgi:uncharacterized protein
VREKIQEPLNPKKTLAEIQRTVERHAQTLKEKYGIRVIGVFGSYRRGKPKKKSDLDLLIEPVRPVSLLELAGAEIYLCEVIGIKVDLVPTEDIREELKEQILHEALYW